MNPDHHPIPDAPPWPLEERVHWLELCLARLHDQVWWMALPFWRRWYYRLRGFKAPMQRFYGYSRDSEREGPWPQ